MKARFLSLLWIGTACMGNSLHARTLEKGDGAKGPFISGHQIGLNIAPLADRFLKFNNSTTPAPGPWLLSYRMFLKERSAIRLGLGGNQTHEKIEASTSSNPRSIQSYRADVAIGYEYYVLNSPRWKCGTGLMVIWDKTDSLSEETDVQANRFIQHNKMQAFGVGANLSLQWRISQRVALGTDAGMYYSKQTNSTKTEFIGPFPQNTYNKSSVSSISPVYPVSLFILFHFN